MSLVRYLLNDPFFNPDLSSDWSVSPRRRQAMDAFDSLWRTQQNLFQAFDDVFSSPALRTPPVQLREEGTEYVVEAEVPGVKREDLDVRVGDGGRSLTIEGHTFRRTGGSQQPQASITEHNDGAASPAPAKQSKANEGTVTTTGSSNKEVATNSPKAQQESTYQSTFSRTFTFPKPVDGSKVSGKLEHGVLTLRIPQLAEAQGVRVNID